MVVRDLPEPFLGWNRTEASYPERSCLHDLVLEQAGRAPHAVAIRQGRVNVSYDELRARVIALAADLVAEGVGPDVPVAVVAERSIDTIIRFLGVLVAGGAFVPLDSNEPAARIERMIAKVGAHLALVPEGFAIGSVRTFRPDRTPRAGGPLEKRADVRNLAYVIFTSGSTGEPKGIAIEHRGIVNNVFDLSSRFSVKHGDRVLSVSALGFDMSIYELLGTLAAGATVVLPDAGDVDPQHIATTLAREEITVWTSAPAVLARVLEAADRTGLEWPNLRVAMLGGDWIPLWLPERLRAKAPNVRFVALGGATEASIHSTIHVVEDVDPRWQSIPYGRPLANQRVYVLDESLAPVPIGAEGELFIGGIGVARGYVGAPPELSRRFMADPFVAGGRMYRTGDRVRWFENGELEILGRVDHQLKIRGVRIESIEVENVFLRHPQVRRAVAVAVGPARDERTLRVAVEAQAPVTVESLRALANESLPTSMIPSEILVVDALPLSPNGKIDRRAVASLPAPTLNRSTRRLPRTELEEFLCTLWCELLDVKEVSVDDDFFALGGHSLLLLRLSGRIQDRYGVKLSLRVLFNLETIEKLARYLEQQLGRVLAGP